MALVLPELAVAQAGGGSGGFGGGGGGGGGGGFSGGGGSGSGGGGGGLFGFVLIVLVFAVIVLIGVIGNARRRRKVRLRRDLVRTAAAEAAQDDAYLDADEVERTAAELYVTVQKAWDDRDVERLRRLVGPDLMVEWSRRLADFERRGWHNRVELTQAPEVQYVGLVNREDDDEDRVTVLIACGMSSYVQTSDGQKMMKDGETDPFVSVTEYWTLARQDDHWMVVSIEQPDEGAHNLDDPVIATPEADTERIHG